MNNDLISREALKKRLQDRHDFWVNAWGGFSNMPLNDKSRVDELSSCIAEVVNAPAVEALLTNEEIKDFAKENFENGYEMAKAKFSSKQGEWIT